MAHLVFQTAFPGDLFLSIPLLRRIKGWEPKTPLVLVCRTGLGEFFLKQHLVDRVIEVDKRSLRGRAKALAELKAEEWDVIFAPHRSLRTAWWVSRLQAKRDKIGFRMWWNQPIFTRTVVWPETLPDALRQLSLLSPLDPFVRRELSAAQGAGLSNPTQLDATLDLRTIIIPEWASMTLAQPRPRSARTVFLAPGSVWPTKRWTMSGYVALARQLIGQGQQVKLVGSALEKPLCDEIANQVPGVINHAGQTTLSGLVDLFREQGACALVSNDSGAMHAAAVAGLPTIAIFGPTTLAQGFRPWQRQAIVVQRELKCRPCGQHGAKVCPINTHDCMKLLTVEQVATALEQLTADIP